MSPDFADVSVVMPAWNNADTIGRALASIAAQTRRPAEVIVVDDGSTDDTIAQVAAMAGAMNGIRLRLFTQPNQGAGAARNRAVAAAGGRWLAFLDADDSWLPAKIERSLAVVEGEGLVMASHDLFNLTPDGTETYNDSHARWARDPADPYRTLFLRGFISSSTVLVRRDAVVAVGGFDETLRSAQDYELWLAVLAGAEGRFRTFPEALLRYTLAPAGITSRIGRKVACSLAILERHMGILKRRPGPVLRLVLLRLLIIHYEAVQGLRGQGRPVAALGQLLLLAPRLLGILIRLPFAKGTRPDFLARIDPPCREVPLCAD
jgi:glycosyltransferase involved in cell wall biosynthesis